jgi:hypothetical protein
MSCVNKPDFRADFRLDSATQMVVGSAAVPAGNAGDLVCSKDFSPFADLNPH